MTIRQLTSLRLFEQAFHRVNPEEGSLTVFSRSTYTDGPNAVA